MSTFSLRTLMLATVGCGILSALFTTNGWNPSGAHLLLVLAFAAPAGSWAFDRHKTQRSVVVGLCVGAVLGTVGLSACVLAVDVLRLAQGY